MESIINSIIKLFSGLTALKFGKELIVFIISILPILELRGGLIAASLLNVSPLTGYIVSIIGNTLPVPFILLFINKILDWMGKSKIKWMNKLSKWLDKKARFNRKIWIFRTYFICRCATSRNRSMDGMFSCFSIKYG